MAQLSYLDLSRNQLSGALPQCWQEMEFLQVFDVGNNNLSGHIPVSLGSLKNLGSLHMENNNLEGNIPTSLQNLGNLLTLDLSENALTGAIPPWIGENLSSLAILSIHSNMFEGEIPPQLCGLASLRILNLAKNKVTGTIPPCFGNFTSMIVDDPDFVDYWLSSFAFPVLFQMPNRWTAYQDHVLAYIKGRALVYNKTLEFRELKNRGLDPALGWKGILAQQQGRQADDEQLNVPLQIKPCLIGTAEVIPILLIGNMHL
ncbi:hypothetical protein GH714_020766 [Hevea brasiliensis]|uniref:Leucine-rich repeat-containing N-terminal plant-type domain-containing protein n=1 Tax=Hevea brasiliensis TaxID=3981 RepID=A0A6A6LL39_HEVBR|nr:hypothetical protein GH714_020766 [Hevea brasiliensis]